MIIRLLLLFLIVFLTVCVLVVVKQRDDLRVELLVMKHERKSRIGQ